MTATGSDRWRPADR